MFSLAQNMWAKSAPEKCQPVNGLTDACWDNPLDLTTIVPATACHQRNYVETYSRYKWRCRVLHTVARVVPRGASPVTNLIRYLGIVYLYLYTSLTKSPKFETSMCVTAVCKYHYINQLRGQSQKTVSQIKVSLLQSWWVYETRIVWLPKWSKLLFSFNTPPKG